MKESKERDFTSTAHSQLPPGGGSEALTSGDSILVVYSLMADIKINVVPCPRLPRQTLIDFYYTKNVGLHHLALYSICIPDHFWSSLSLHTTEDLTVKCSSPEYRAKPWLVLLSSLSGGHNLDKVGSRRLGLFSFNCSVCTWLEPGDGVWPEDSDPLSSTIGNSQAETANIIIDWVHAARTTHPHQI